MDITVCGIPCQAVVLEFSTEPNGYIHLDYVLTIKGSRAKWLEEKLALDSKEEDRLFNEISERYRY
jgi:hypothetical protein